MPPETTHDPHQIAKSLPPEQILVLAAVRGGATKSVAAKAGNVDKDTVDEWLALGRNGDPRFCAFADLYSIAIDGAVRDLRSEVMEISRGKPLQTLSKKRVRMEVPVHAQTGDVLTEREADELPEHLVEWDYRMILVEETETLRETTGDWRGVAWSADKIEQEHRERKNRKASGLLEETSELTDEDLQLRLRELSGEGLGN